MQPPATSWAIPCDEQVVELDAVEPIRASLGPGETYHVIVNDMTTTTFSLPRSNFGHSFIAESPVESAEIMVLESAPPQYQPARHIGSSQGQRVLPVQRLRKSRRGETNDIEVIVTHHEVADPMVICTADFPIVETVVPLGSDFELGEKYTVRVNSDTVTSFVAQ